MNYNYNQNRFLFPTILTPDLTDGGYIVTFPDLPEAITQGDTIEECLTEAKDCLEEAIALRIDDQLEIPEPSLIESEYKVNLSLPMTLKAILYLTIKESGITYQELAYKIKIDETEITNNLNPHYPTSLSILEQILLELGKKLQVNLV